VTPLRAFGIFAAVVACGFAVQLLARLFDSPCIRKHVERQGGKVIDIVPRAAGSMAWCRFYDVRYETCRGANVTATCGIDVWGVHWPGHTPRRSLPEENKILTGRSGSCGG